jgi:hypothetical protein
VLGDHLDNAMGSSLEPWLMIRGAHEYIVVIEREDREPHLYQFNLADLIALARLAILPEDD